MKTITVLMLLLLVGCGQVDLHHGLTENEAAEVMTLLHQQGIETRKEKEVSGQDVSWKVTVSPREIANARQILIINNLPRKRELGLSGVYKEKGLIPTPDEQKARFLLALKGEIINSLLKLPGVVDADIVLNVPPTDEFAGLGAKEKRTTASVVVRTQPMADITADITEGKVQRFVANAVPNLDPNDVTVMVSRSDGGRQRQGSSTQGSSAQGSLFGGPVAAKIEGVTLTELAGMKLDPGSVRRVKTYFITLLSLLIVVAGALLVNIVRYNRLRVRLQAGTPVEPVPLEGGGRAMLGGGGQVEGGVEGTFDVGRRDRG